MPDEELEILGEYFVNSNLSQKGWEFHEFLTEYLNGNISFYYFQIKDKQDYKFTCLHKTKNWLSKWV